LNKTVFKVKGIRGIITAPTIKKIVLSELLYGKPNSFVDVPGTKIQGKYIEELLPLIENEESGEKRQMRLILQDRIKGVFLNSSHIPDMVQALTNNRKLFSDEIVGNGYGVVNHDPYITIG